MSAVLVGLAVFVGVAVYYAIGSALVVLADRWFPTTRRDRMMRQVFLGMAWPTTLVIYALLAPAWLVSRRWGRTDAQ